MSDHAGLATPVAPSQRIMPIDVLRGIALLGIRIMNIQGFSIYLPELAKRDCALMKLPSVTCC